MKRQFLFGTMFAVALGAGAAAQTPSGAQTGTTSGSASGSRSQGQTVVVTGCLAGGSSSATGAAGAGTTGATGTTGSFEREWRLHAHGREHVQCIGHELG